MYHDVVEALNADESGFTAGAASSYKVDADLFREHLDATMERLGPFSAEPAEANLGRPTSALLLTFDDGGVSAATRVADMLEARGLRGLFFVTTDLIGAHGFLTDTQIRNLRSRGHVIGSHTRSHPKQMSGMSRQEIRAEWRESIATLRDVLGEPVNCASVPNGAYSLAVGEEAAAAGITFLFTSEPTRSRPRVGGCTLVGRFCVRSWSRASWVASVAAGDTLTCRAAWFSWATKAVVRKLSHSGYVWLRQLLRVKSARIELDRRSDGEEGSA